MSNATKCDRCGGYFEQGGKAIRQGFGSDMAEFDLCPDCAEAFDAWMERGQMADATNKSNSQFDVLKTVETAKNATSKNEIHNFNDSREHLEADVREYYRIGLPGIQETELHRLYYEQVLVWLDRQAAITAEETSGAWEEYRDATQCEIAELTAERDALADDLLTCNKEREEYRELFSEALTLAAEIVNLQP